MLDGIIRRMRSVVQESCMQCDSDLLALSGGLDSTVAGFCIREKKPGTVTVIAEDFVSTDLTYSQMAAKHLGLELSMYGAGTVEILEAVEQTIRILGNFNDIEIRNATVMYLALRWAKENGHDSVITGDGADELFAGYGFLVAKSGEELESEIARVCSVMHFPTQEIGRALRIRTESPFLGPGVVEFARDVPASLKVAEEGGKRYGKWILRKAFEGDIPRQVAWRPKSPMQDGAGTSGLTGLFESVTDEREYVEKKLRAEADDGVIIRSRESMHYYEIFSRMYGSPASKNARRPCPYCRHEAADSKFCRMCGAFPI